MKEIQGILKIMSDGLKTLAQGVEALSDKIDELGKSQTTDKPKEKKATTVAPKSKTAKKPAGKAIKKQKGVKTKTASDIVFDIISRSRKGASTAKIVEKTGYDKKKVANIIYRLKKKGKIKIVDKGVYLKS